jgi:hypothetical protein
MGMKGLARIKNLVFCSLVILIAGKFTSVPQAFHPIEIEVCDAENNAFLPGEKIEYELYYNWGFLWIPAGVVQFEVKDKNKFIEVTAIGTTYPSYDSFYKVRDTFYSLIDKQTLLPTTFYRDIKEGRYIMNSKIEFNQEKHTASSIVTKRGKTRSYTFEYANCMHDLISILYYFRNLDYSNLQEKSKLPVDVLLDSKVYNLNVRYDGIEKKKKVKGLGKYHSLKFALELIAGHIFKEGDEMKAWITNDRNKIALLIESPVSVGSVKAILSDYSGLRYDFSSKVE